ncbi:uncharacterized protein Tco025E_00893 [Trypanosoma conorhini]|uniref:Uncharacterized protein n=1 Tax=Trypanosoma conorhini TaxID=83891 RepID=A0A422QAD1_9TRYP|nr:uncharacterized protein Tco025E_00893 [Trypanosoma conorhini]RNF26930.1 hypothetical protein Tco025E_00893 [Trypanosoma conorhini]
MTVAKYEDSLEFPQPPPSFSNAKLGFKRLMQKQNRTQHNPQEKKKKNLPGTGEFIVIQSAAPPSNDAGAVDTRYRLGSPGIVDNKSDGSACPSVRLTKQQKSRDPYSRSNRISFRRLFRE